MTNQELEKILYFHNPWWREKKVPQELLPPFKRPILEQLKKYLKTLNRIIIIKGPRRTGKTTLLYQLIQDILDEKKEPLEILFLSFDDLKLRQDLEKTLGIYEKIRGKTLKEPQIYCFLDEVHFLDNWSLIVKKYFDKKYPIKFIVSSSSASLFKKSLESLAGRTVEELILPFNFKEFVCYFLREDKNFLEFLEKKKFTPYASELKILFEKYLNRGGFPHLLEVNEPSLWEKLLREDVLEKVIYRDLVGLYGIREPEKLEKTFLYLSNITGQILNFSNLAKNLGISRQHLEKYIFYLKESYLIFLIPSWGYSPAKSIRKPSKIHLIDPGLANVFGLRAKQDLIIESIVARHLFDLKGKLSYFRNHYEIDFILENKKEIKPIEVKNKEKPEVNDFKNLFLFMKKYKLKEGLLLCQDYEGEKKSENFTIKIMPLWKWLMEYDL